MLQPTPPTVAELQASGVNRDAIDAAVATGRLVRVSPEIMMTPELVARITGWLSARRVLVRTMHVGARSLEEVYLELTG